MNWDWIEYEEYNPWIKQSQAKLDKEREERSPSPGNGTDKIERRDL
jgi:hypothetical protein